MTILGPTNTKAGDMSSPSASSKISTTAGRQYWDHNPAVVYPDSNVVRWTVNWKAPDLPSGSQITWWAAGNLADGNQNTSGDRIVSAHASGSIVLAATNDVSTTIARIFPNPGNERIQIEINGDNHSDGKASFYDLSGKIVGECEFTACNVNVPSIPSGLYFLRIKTAEQLYTTLWAKI